MKNLFLTNEQIARINDLNVRYIQLVKELVDTTENAHLLIGVPEETAKILQDIPRTKMKLVTECGVPICQLRIDNPQFWQKLQSEEDANFLLHELIETISGGDDGA